jgi:hypothetical protein
VWHCAAVAPPDYSARLREHAREQFARLPPGVRRQVLHGLGRYAPWESGFDFTPPPLGAGEATGPPDFVGIGVQKCGTTWWYDLVMHHPRLYGRADIHKERHYFDRFGAEAFGQDDVEGYAGWFPRPPGTLTGEWTPDYFGLPWAPLLLKSAAPDVRLLLLLRDPVERFRSGLAHRRRMGESVGPAAVNDAVQRGYYHRLLLDWLAHFDRRQLLILQYERCNADPAAQLRATFRFLDLPDPDAAAPAAERPATTRAAAAEAPADLDPAVRRRLVSLYSADVAHLARSVPDIDLTLWPNFAHLAGGGAGSEDGPNSPSRRP